MRPGGTFALPVSTLNGALLALYSPVMATKGGI